ncbi:hypothetical protein [Brucella vulpis]
MQFMEAATGTQPTPLFQVQSVPTNLQAIGTGSMIHISPQGREFTAAYFF